MNRNRLYRLSNSEANKYGLPLNKSKRYRVPQEVEDMILLKRKQSIKRLFFDIETTPNIIYSWRVGWKINVTYDNIIKERQIICVSYKWEHENRVHNIAWNGKCDKNIIEEFIPIMNQASEIIAHNGDRFDIKWLRTRALFHGLPMLPYYRTLDTLKKARNYFNFNSNRLDYIGQFLGIGQKLEHNGFDLWKEVIEGNGEALQRMVNYCNQDVILLQDIFEFLKHYVRPKTNAAVINDGRKWQCPLCGSDRVSYLKPDVTPKGTIKRWLKCECDYTYQVSNKAYMDKFVRNS